MTTLLQSCIAAHPQEHRSTKAHVLQYKGICTSVQKEKHCSTSLCVLQCFTERTAIISLQLPLDKLTTLATLLQFVLEEALSVFGNITAGKDIGNGYAQGNAKDDE